MEKFKYDINLLMLVLFSLFSIQCDATGGSVSYQYLTQDGVGGFSYTLSHSAPQKPGMVKPTQPPKHVPIFKEGAKGQTIQVKPLRLSAYTNQEDFVPLVVDAADDDSIKPTTMIPTVEPIETPEVDDEMAGKLAAHLEFKKYFPAYEHRYMASNVVSGGTSSTSSSPDSAGKSQQVKATYAGMDVKQVPGAKKNKGSSNKAKKPKAVHTKPKKPSTSTSEKPKKSSPGIRHVLPTSNAFPVAFPTIQPPMFQLPMQYAPAVIQHGWYEPRYVHPMVHPVNTWHGPVHIPLIMGGVPLDTPEVQFAKAVHLDALATASGQSEAKEGGSEGTRPQAEWYHRDP